MVSVLVILIGASRIFAQAEMPRYETKYYIIYTDLGSDDEREAEMRMTRMAEEYYNRTKDFAGQINRKLPFYLYSKKEDYYASGAPKGSAGYFDGEKLVAVAEDMSVRTWHTVQHEGFHQFAHFMIRGRLPTWVDEGLAEYFGEALFTGDEFIIGVIPHGRMVRIQQALQKDKFKSLDGMMHLSLKEWNADLEVLNYDQGWSMVQFLANGDGGKYQKPFADFMGDLGRGKDWEKAWQDRFGGTEGFEKLWRNYWSNLQRNPTIELYAQANVSTFTSFLGRAFSQQQKFPNFAAFLAAAEQKSLKSNPKDWLPPSLLTYALTQQKLLSENQFIYTIQTTPLEPVPQIICTLPDGRRVVGKFTIRDGRIGTVKTTLLPKSR